MLVVKMIKYILLTLILCTPSLSYGSTYFIATNGNDSNAGTILAPWSSLVNGAFPRVGPDDIVNIRSGTYFDEINEQRVHIPSGTSGHPITFQGYPSDPTPPIEMSYFDAGINLEKAAYTIWKHLVINTTNGRTWTGSGVCTWGILVNYPLSNPEHDNRFEDIEVIGSGTPTITGQGILGGHTGDVFTNVRIHDFSSTGIYADSDGATFDNVESYNNGAHGFQACNGAAGSGALGIQVYSAGHFPVNIIVKNSRFHDNASEGCIDVGENTLWVNNICDHNGGVGFVSGISGSSGSQGIRMYNNVIANNGGGIIITSNSDSVQLVNNISFGNGGSQISGTGGTCVLFPPCVQTPNITTDPSFISPSTGNYQLNVGSIAIATGANLSSIFTYDHTGATRSSPWDQGAYIFGGGGGGTRYIQSEFLPGSRMIVGEQNASRTVTGDVAN